MTNAEARAAADWAAWNAAGAIPLADCTAREIGGGYEVLAPDGAVVVAQDYAYAFAGAGSRLEKAWQILCPAVAAPWKTVELLRTLRQALREHDVQMMTGELPPDGATQDQVQAFLGVARIQDAIHHGEETF